MSDEFEKAFDLEPTKQLQVAFTGSVDTLLQRVSEIPLPAPVKQIEIDFDHPVSSNLMPDGSISFGFVVKEPEPEPEPSKDEKIEEASHWPYAFSLADLKKEFKLGTRFRIKAEKFYEKRILVVTNILSFGIVCQDENEYPPNRWAPWTAGFNWLGIADYKDKKLYRKLKKGEV